jgi:hypothetical protein
MPEIAIRFVAPVFFLGRKIGSYLLVEAFWIAKHRQAGSLSDRS